MAAAGAFVDKFGETEIENFDEAVFGDHDVFRFQITMGDAGFVRFCQAFGDLRGDVENLAHGDQAGFQQLAKGLACDKLHGDVVACAVAAEFVDRDDVGVVERGGGFGFLFKAKQAFDVSGKCGGKNLDGDATFEAGVNGMVDLAHAARAQRADDLERSYAASGIHGSSNLDKAIYS